MTAKRRPFVLAILDGWGTSTSPHGNAVLAADLPNWTRILATYPHTLLEASGEAVGLPAGVMGNSEVGHINIGSGRVVPQGVVVIDDEIASGTFGRTRRCARASTTCARPAARCTCSGSCRTARCTARSTTSKR